MMRCPNQSEYHERVAVTSEEHALAPHERSWSIAHGDHDPDDRGAIEGCWTVDVPTPSRYTDGCLYMSQVTLCFYDEERAAKLASAAPDMARVLLAVEWSLAPGGCPSCKNLMPYEHKPDCALDAALRKAGVR